MVRSHGRSSTVAATTRGLPALLGECAGNLSGWWGVCLGQLTALLQILQPEQKPKSTGLGQPLAPAFCVSAAVLRGRPSQPQLKPERAGSFGFLLRS